MSDQACAVKSDNRDCQTIGSETVCVMHYGQRSIPVPYAVTLGAVNFAGILYLKDPLESSYTDGAFIGAVSGTYHIDKDDAEACADNGLLKACIKISFAENKLFGRICTRNFTGGWDCGGWKEIVRW